jgi:hypothetical protein
MQPGWSGWMRMLKKCTVATACAQEHMKLTCARYTQAYQASRLLVLCGVRTVSEHTVKLRVMSEWPNSILAARGGSDFLKKTQGDRDLGSIRNGCITCVPVAHVWLISGTATHLARMRSRSAHPAVHLRLRNEPYTELQYQPRLACLNWSSRLPLLRSSLI